MLRVLFVLQRIFEHQPTSDDSTFLTSLHRAVPLVDFALLLGLFCGSLGGFMDASQRALQR